ncbi:CAAX amino protease [Aeromicrobium flavum]|uniref:CAAX amino protease n=1 Tax=Aeromicrobium flavum TaxID=416568 RepID=A0A512HU27_9ACTN|nr:type II CAAX endopeptidase family protein [Aeromicrobium flavum]GEO88945.1 CAAX amino protease [Aeromicrobium flavum]
MTPYHRLVRDSPDFAHWRLPVAALLGAVAYAFLALGIVLVAMVVLAIAGNDPEAWLDAMSDEVPLDDPGELAFQLGVIAAMLPCVLVPVAVVWRRHVGFLHSVAGHLRWGWLGRCAVLAFVVVGVSLGLAVVVAAIGGDESVRFDSLDGRAVASLLVVLLLVPFQAAAEEYVFRGGLLQLIGSWTRWAAVPVLATSVLFAAGHLYDFWGLVSVFAFGVIAAVMTIRTGGLEAAIGLHVANNVVLMVLDLVGLVDSSGEGAGLLDEVVPSTLMCLVYWALVEWFARRGGLQRRRAPLPPLPTPAPAYRVVPPPPYVPPGEMPPVVAPPAPPAAPVAAPRPEVPSNAPFYPGDPGVWGR